MGNLTILKVFALGLLDSEKSSSNAAAESACAADINEVRRREAFSESTESAAAAALDPE